MFQLELSAVEAKLAQTFGEVCRESGLPHTAVSPFVSSMLPLIGPAVAQTFGEVCREIGLPRTAGSPCDSSMFPQVGPETGLKIFANRRGPRDFLDVDVRLPRTAGTTFKVAKEESALTFGGVAAEIGLPQTEGSQLMASLIPGFWGAIELPGKAGSLIVTAPCWAALFVGKCAEIGLPRTAGSHFTSDKALER